MRRIFLLLHYLYSYVEAIRRYLYARKLQTIEKIGIYHCGRIRITPECRKLKFLAVRSRMLRFSIAYFPSAFEFSAESRGD